jgi:prevent-host-death family protein
MPQDARLLSMTELRNRPGEILDRVAKHGEAFIIERNGSRKACLVPLAAFFPDISPARIANEIMELEKHGEKPRITITEARELTFRFSLEFSDDTPTRLTSDDTPTELTIVLPHGYPNICPRVYANPTSVNAPHRWGDGALCVYGVMSGWNPGKHTVFSTLKLARKWLQHYDTWRQSGQWPKPKGLPDE